MPEIDWNTEVNKLAPAASTQKRGEVDWGNEAVKLAYSDSTKANYDLSRGRDPKHEAAVAKVSAATGIPKLAVNANPQPETLLPMQPPAPGVSSYLQDMGNMIISRDDIHNLNAVEPKALAFNLDYAKGDLSGQMRTNIQKDIQSNGYTDGQKAELIANGYRPNIDGTWNTPDGRPTSAMPVLDLWVQTKDEQLTFKDLAEATSAFGGKDFKEFNKPESAGQYADPDGYALQKKYDASTPEEQQAMRNAEIARIQAASDKIKVVKQLPEDFAGLPVGTQEAVIQGIRAREGMDASVKVNPSEYLKKTVKDIEPRSFLNYFGANDLRKFLDHELKDASAVENLTAANGDTSKVSIVDLSRTADLLTRKAEEARGETFGSSAVNAVAGTLNFMAELASVSGVSAKAAKGIFTLAGRGLSAKAVEDIAARYAAKTSSLTLTGMAEKAVIKATELGVQTTVTSVAYLPKVGLTAFENTLPDTLQLTPDEKGNVVAQVSGIKKEYATEFTKAYLSNAIDVFTEGTGEKILGLAAGVYAKMPKSEKVSALLSKMTQPMRENFVTSAIASMAGKAKSKGAFLAGLGKFRKGAKWDGFTGEWVEEDLGKAMQYLFTQAGSATGIESINLGENSPTAYNNPEEIMLRAVALAVPSLGFGTARLGAHIMEARDTNHFVNKAEDLNKALYNTQTAQRSPIHAALFLDAQGVKGDIYMNSQELLDLENKNPGLLEKIGAPLDLVTSAADTNMDVAVPAVHALSLQPEVFAQLRNVMRPGVSSPSVADLGKVDLKPIAQAAMVEPQRIAEEEKIFQTKLAEKKNEALKAGRSKEEVDAWSELVEGMANRLAQYGGNRMAMLDYSIQKADQAAYFNQNGGLTQPADTVKVFHHSEENISQFKDNPEGTWFTSNEYGYARRPKASVHNVAYVSKNLKWAKEKDMGPWLGKPEEVRKNLMAKGFDGVKYMVDGDTHYLVFDAKNIQREGLKQTSDSINGMVDTQAKLVSLFQTANPSTLIHETAHIFKHEMDLLLQNGPPNEELARDMEVLNAWLNAKPESSSVNAYDAAQNKINILEKQLEEKGVDVAKLADANDPASKDLIGFDGYTAMPADLAEAYAERERIGAGQLRDSITAMSSGLSKIGLTDAEISKILKAYSLDVGAQGGIQQYFAAEYTKGEVSKNKFLQAENLAKILAEVRSEDFASSKKTLADAAKAVKVIRAYFGGESSSAKQLEQSGKTSASEYVRMQEQFASGLETYLMEGKAPSGKLAAVFERYKNWLLNVYSSIKNFLAVRQDAAPLNDDMRGFFDRMLATHDETVQAMNIEKAFMLDSPELGGDAKYRETAKGLYADMMVEAEAIINAKREKYIKEHKAEWRKEAEDKVYAEPINQAWKKIEDEGGLDKKDLELELSKEEIKVLRDRGLVQSGRSKRSISHMLVANEHGFRSSELLTALLKAESPNSQIKAALDARIKEFTDTFKPEDYFAETAAMAKYLELRNDQLNELINQSRVDKDQWKTELNALTGGKVDTPFQTAKVLAFVNSKGVATDSISAKSIAEITEGELDEDVRRVLEIVQIGRRMQNVAKTLSQDAYRAKIAEQMKNVPVGQLESPGHYLRAFKKNMQEAVYAMRKKDWGAVLNYNNLARQNYEQLRQSREIRDGVSDTLRIIHRAAVAKPGVIEGDFKAWIMQIGRKFGLTERQVPAELPGKLQLASDNIYFGEEYEPWISEGLLNPTNFAVLPNVSYKGMTSENFKSLANLIDYLNRQGRSMAEGWDATNKKKIVDVIKEIRQPLAENKTQVVDVQENVGIPGVPYLQHLYRGYKAEMSRAQFLCIALDNFMGLRADSEPGPFEKYLFRPLSKAADKKSKRAHLIAEQAKPFNDVLNKWMLANPGILRGEGVPDLPANTRGVYKGWTAEMMLSYMLNRGQPDNVQKFIDGYPGLTIESMDAFCAKFAGEEQWKAVQGLWDIIDSFWPDLDRVHYAMHLTHMGKMPAGAFSILTKDGKMITQKGGYYPVWYDRRLTDFYRKETENDLAFTNKLETEALNIALFTPKAAPFKSGKERQESAKYAIDMTVNPLYRYIDGAIHYITHAEVGRDVMRIVDYKKGEKESEVKFNFMGEVTRVLGREKALALREHFVRVIAPQFEKLDGWDKVTNIARGSSTLLGLGAKLVPAVKQYQSAPRFVYELGVEKYLSGLVSFYSHPVESFKMINEKAAFMRNRFEGADTALRRGVDGITTGKWEHMNTFVSDFAFALMRVNDALSTYPGWLAQYNSALIDNNGDEEAAIESANRLIQFSQATDRAIDKSEFQMGEKGVKRLINMFMSEASVFNQRMNTYYKAFRTGKISFMSYLMYIMCELLAPAVMSTIINRLYYGVKKDETWAGSFIKNAASGLISGTPVARDVFESFYNTATGAKGNFNITPINMIWSLADTNIRAISNVLDSDSNTYEGQQKLDKFYLSTAETIGFVSRLSPVVNIYKQFKRIEKRIDEEEGVTP